MSSIIEARQSIPQDEANAWRLKTPGNTGWSRTARPDDPNKYFMVSSDTHANEPPDLWQKRIEEKYRDRLPKMWVDENGVRWRTTEGNEKPDRLVLADLSGQDQYRSKAGAGARNRLRDHEVDGIDVEVIFPNKGLAMWYTPDPEFAQAQCRVYNTWAWEEFGEFSRKLLPVAAIAPGDIPGALAEIERVAKLGFKGVAFPVKPMYGAGKVGELNYNRPAFDPIWAALQDADLTLCFHVATGKDPRTSRGEGGAVINYVWNALSPAIEPLTNICASGVIERFPKLRFGSVEAGIGFIPWMMEIMDEAYKKHHFAVRPKLKMLPSEYFRSNGFATFGEDKPGLELIEKFDLTDNFLWANDYPHHEGTWPHSAEAIERDMAALRDETRAKVLGLNAARIFNIDIEAAKKPF
jgi:predicted TIM-barrel fold metal-dependent hydrolase